MNFTEDRPYLSLLQAKDDSEEPVTIHYILIRIEGALMRKRFGVDSDGTYKITEGNIKHIE